MANRSYLCCSDVERIYPGFENPDFDPHEQILACGIYVLPALWLPLFRLGDWREEKFHAAATNTLGSAPLVSRQQSFDNLDSALPAIQRIFEGRDDMAAYVSLMEQCLDQASGQFLTIEMEEIALLWELGEESFYSAVKQVLKYIEDGEGDPANMRRICFSLSSLESAQDLPLADKVLECLPISAAEEQSLSRLMGSSLHQAVPWE